MRIRSWLMSVRIIGWASLASAVGFLGLPGCGETDRARSTAAAVTSTPAGVMADESAVPRSLMAMAPQSPPPPAEGEPVPTPKAAANRKIIYTTTVDLVTEDLNTLESSLTGLIQSHGAYVADSSRSGATGSTRRGHWKVRVPVDAYDTFVRGVIGLGELVSTQAQSEDVSAEYYDLDARQTAKKVEETRLLKHLVDSTGRLDEILTVERELSRVRSEIERMQGRLAVLGNLTALATVTLTAAEIKGYTPPQAPTLGVKVARTFSESLDSLKALGEAVLLFVVALAPWLPLLIPAAFLILWAIRRATAYLATPRGVGVAPRAS